MKEIVMDIDGTILTDSNIVSVNTRYALFSAQKKGIQVVLASGRPSKSMMKIAKEICLEQFGGIILSNNGSNARFFDTGDIIIDEKIPHYLAIEIIQQAKAYGLFPLVDDGEYLYVENTFSGEIWLNNSIFNVLEFEIANGEWLLHKVDDLTKFITFPINKITITGDPSKLAENCKKLYEAFKEKVNGTLSTPFYFDITNYGVDKSSSLSIINKKLGISPAEVIAFGDSQNDLSMIQYAGIGVAMGNGSQEVKKNANFVTKSNNDDGIPYALKNFYIL